jgi:hypothetical protein
VLLDSAKMDNPAVRHSCQEAVAAGVHNFAMQKNLEICKQKYEKINGFYMNLIIFFLNSTFWDRHVRLALDLKFYSNPRKTQPRIEM